MSGSWVDTFFFATVCGVALIAALKVVFSRNPVHSALMLALTLFAVAVIFIAQSAPFLAAVQMIVYAGAVVVLFLFVIMLLGVDRNDDLRESLKGQRFGALVLVVLFESVIFAVIRIYQSAPSSVLPQAAIESDNVQRIAEVLFTTYLYAFEITAAPILVAAIAAIVLAKRERPIDRPGDVSASSEPETGAA